MGTNATATDDFDPPSSYAFEPEFTGIGPRSIPTTLEDGPCARERRATIVNLFVLGVICSILPYAPGVATLAYYVLPLAYLRWIGAASIVGGAALTIAYQRRSGPFRYVREGMPIVARIAHLGLVASKAGYNIQAYRALLVYRDPVTGRITRSAVQSGDIAPLRAYKYRCPFKVGDYATAVYLPGQPVAQSLRLYAFLDLNPRVNIRSSGSETSSLRRSVFVGIYVVLLLSLIASLYGIERYPPLDAGLREVGPPAAFGALLVGPLVFRLLVPQRLSGLLQKAWAGVFLAFVSGLIGVSLSFLANAWLDRSPPKIEPAEVVELWSTTHSFVVRTYTIQYRLADSIESHRLLTTLDHLQQFQDQRALARVRQGALGWKWVESVDPAPVE